MAKEAKKRKRRKSPPGRMIERFASSPGELRYDLAWPMIACYGPTCEVWQVSGFGTGFAARHKPNGAEVCVIGMLALSEGGLTTVGGKRDAAPGAHKGMVLDLGRFAASVALSEADVADYLYGALRAGLQVVGRIQLAATGTRGVERSFSSARRSGCLARALGGTERTDAVGAGARRSRSRPYS